MTNPPSTPLPCMRSATFAGLFFLIILSEKPMLEARRLHIELLKEIKQVQVQLLELQLQIGDKTLTPSPGPRL